MQVVQLLRKTFGWEVRPDRQIGNTRRGTRHLKVFAIDAPPEGAKVELEGSASLIDIVPFVEDQKITAAKAAVQKYYAMNP